MRMTPARMEALTTLLTMMRVSFEKISP